MTSSPIYSLINDKDMRQIKFRVWCHQITDGEVTLPGHMDYELAHYKLLAVKTETRQPPEDFGFEHIQHGLYFINKDLGEYGDRLMQFTGLHDKNGKEIYEGDIILLWENDKKGVIVLWDEEIAGFGFRGQDMATHLNFRKLSTRNYVVIGNIYENPELIHPPKP